MRTYTYGTTPPEVIAQAAPPLFAMRLGATDARTVATASPLSAVAIGDNGGLTPEQLLRLLSDLLDAPEDVADDAASLRMSVLIVLNVEEV